MRTLLILILALITAGGAGGETNQIWKGTDPDKWSDAQINAFSNYINRHIVYERPPPVTTNWTMFVLNSVHTNEYFIWQVPVDLEIGLTSDGRVIWRDKK